MVLSSTPSNADDEEMFSKAPLLIRLVSAGIRIAEKAGVLVREILNDGSFQIVEKGLNDLQTEADRRSQKCIISSLKHQFKDFPKMAIIGEEVYILFIYVLFATEIFELIVKFFMCRMKILLKQSIPHSL